MKYIQNVTTFPFNEKHLQKFRKELNKVGTFDDLMMKKEALKRSMGMKYICLTKNIDVYKRKHLKGVYANLQPMYDTEMPYVFWSNLYEILLETEVKNV